MNSICVMPVTGNQNYKAKKPVAFQAKLITNNHLLKKVADEFEAITCNMPNDILSIFYVKGKLRISFRGPCVKNRASNPWGCRQFLLSHIDSIIWSKNNEELTKEERNSRYMLLNAFRDIGKRIYSDDKPKKAYYLEQRNFNYRTGEYYPADEIRKKH